MLATRLPTSSIAASRISSRVGTAEDLRSAGVASRVGTVEGKPGRGSRASAPADENQPSVQERFTAASRRVERITEVNGRLQSALVQRRMTAQQIKAELDSLEQRIDSCRAVEEPARVADLETLEGEIKEEQRRLQESSLELGRGIMDLDERVAALSSGNAATREASTRRRAMLKEQQSELRAQQRAVRNLSRHIQIMEEGTDYDQLAGWSLSDVRMPDSQILDPEAPDEELPGAAPSSPTQVDRCESKRSKSDLVQFGASFSKDLSGQPPPQTIEDYRKLPGLDLQFLLGHAGPMP